MNVMTEWQEALLGKQALLALTIFSVILIPISVVLTNSIIPAVVIFPLGTLGVLHFTTFGIPLIIVSVFQFFIYGAFVKKAAQHGRLGAGLTKVVIIHFAISLSLAGWLVASSEKSFML